MEKIIILLLSVAACFASPRPNPFGNETRAKCGQPAIKPDTSSHIVGGKDAIPYSWPWQAPLFKGSFTCSSTLISNQWVMTAAHCVKDNPTPSLYRVKLGVFAYSKNDEPGEEIRKIVEVQIHPKYVNALPSRLVYDIALLKLEKPVEFTDHISPVCLPTEQDEEVPAAGSSIIETGWGRTTEGGALGEKLQQVTDSISDLQKCKEVYGKLSNPFEVDPKVHFCNGIGDDGKGSCQGDSGGPAVVQDPKNNNAWKQVGIISAAVGCARGKYGAVKSKVSAYVDFINTHVKDL
jgi:secreted trypsin-like serine protease